MNPPMTTKLLEGERLFQRKPEPVKAFRYTKEYYDAVYGTKDQPQWLLMYESHARLMCRDGMLVVRLGDWIITNQNGDRTAMGDTEFNFTYEPTPNAQRLC